MELAGLLLILWTIIGSIVLVRRGGPGPCCPACAHTGREAIEEARAHLGWKEDTERRWPTYATRHHLLCRHCGHRWWCGD
jgi:hypothetical protein